MSFFHNQNKYYYRKLWLPDGGKIYECAHHAQSTLKKQQILYEAHKFCDVVLIAGINGTKVPAHKMVLSASSEYFLAMFGGNMIEAEAKEVTFEQINGTTLKSLVDFIYSGSIELRNETVVILLRTAHLFQLDAVVAACCDYMLQQLNLSNCLGMALIAEQHNCKELYEQSFGLACSNFEKVSTEEEFLDLNDEQIGKFLSRDDLCVSSEEKVFHALVAWVNHKPNREQSMVCLLSHVRFYLLKPSFILTNRNSVCKSPECDRLIFDWLEWHENPSTKHIKPRRTNDKLALVSQFSLTARLKIQTYQTSTNEWHYIDIPPPVNWREFYHNWFYADSKLIIAGGRVKDVFTKSVECLDLQTMIWTDLPPMRTARDLCSLVELNGQLYVVGGGVPGKWSLSKCDGSVEKYDFRTRKWQTVASLRRRLGLNILVAVLDGLMYAIGVDTCALECYDPRTNKWSQRADKSEKSTQFGMAAAGRYLYTLGGYYNRQLSRTVERYDPTKDCWSVVSQLKIGRTNIKCITLGNRLIAFGGFDGAKNANIIEEYNLDTEEWKYLSPAPFFSNFSCIPVLIKERVNC